ncbi:MAG TPA: hypothetical protein EYP49_19640 [Anaerolineae bacterium]|nr:hypothetical protein [Anaerolineae bacterium]
MDKEVHSRVYESARQQERERVRAFIEDIKNEIAGAPFFLNLFAPKGFGKTAFLGQIWENYERVLPASLVRVGDFRKEGGETLALNDLLVHIIRDLGERLPRRVAPLPPDYEELTNEKQLAELLLNLISGAKDYEKVTLLLMDDYDLMPEKQRRWFQENIFSPAARTRKIAVILTSATELRFTESFDLRMRLECRELRSLDPEAISRALPEYEGIAGEIHRITGGLPLLTEKFIEQLKASQVATSADFQAHAQELTGKYYRAYVENRVLADLAPDVLETMLTLTLLRRFDVKVLKKILPDLLPEPYQSYGTADYLDLIDHLRPWVEWRRQGGYTLNPAFRLMLQGYVLTIKPDLYKRVNRAAEVMYRGWLESEYREHYLIELLYHVLALHRAEEAYGLFPVHDEMSQIRVSDELLKYLTGDGGHRVQEADLDSLRNSLKQDPDLKYYISEDVEDTIQALIDQKIKEEEAQKKIIPLSSKAG